MQVKDLIEALQCMDPEADVHFAYNYGDHWRTEVAPRISGVREGVVEFSDYHRMDKLVTIEEDYDIYDEDTNETRTEVRRVVVLA
jgi:tRNA/tmRNA/rRNA uracil-C5-methylase (TrmA/RlmC/RlmD family)